MRKAKDEMRPEYKRSDFAKSEREKFYAEVAAGTSVALLEPEIAKDFRLQKQLMKHFQAYLF